jgi:hypothetical protein
MTNDNSSSHASSIVAQSRPTIAVLFKVLMSRIERKLEKAKMFIIIEHSWWWSKTFSNTRSKSSRISSDVSNLNTDLPGAASILINFANRSALASVRGAAALLVLSFFLGAKFLYYKGSRWYIFNKEQLKIAFTK